MTTMRVSLPTDNDGFLSQECPACSKRFKVRFGEGAERPIGHCPYCGHAEEGCWWTQAQAEYLAHSVGDAIIGSMLGDFAEGINRISSSGDAVSVHASVEHDPPAPAPVEPNEPMPTAVFSCCNERIKHDGSSNELHCIICGKGTQV